MKFSNNPNKLISAVLVIAVLSSCAGRTGNPVMTSQYGDRQKPCKSLELEIQNIEAEMSRLLPKTDKTAKNVALGVAGWFVIVPWFFMDFKNGEQVEYEAYRQRYNSLAILATEKNCDVKPQTYPSVDEIKKEVDAQNKEKNKKNSKPSK